MLPESCTWPLPLSVSTAAPVMLFVNAVRPPLLSATVALPSRLTAPVNTRLLLPLLPIVNVWLGTTIGFDRLIDTLLFSVPPSTVKVPLPRAVLLPSVSVPPASVSAAAEAVGVVQRHRVRAGRRRHRQRTNGVGRVDGVGIERIAPGRRRTPRRPCPG